MNSVIVLFNNFLFIRTHGFAWAWGWLAYSSWIYFHMSPCSHWMVTVLYFRNICRIPSSSHFVGFGFYRKLLHLDENYSELTCGMAWRDWMLHHRCNNYVLLHLFPLFTGHRWRVFVSFSTITKVNRTKALEARTFFPSEENNSASFLVETPPHP